MPFGTYRCGSIQEPFIAYEEGAVSIVFTVLEARGDGCPPTAAAVGVPMTVRLSQPLGDRDLVDGGAGEVRFVGRGQFVVFIDDPERITDLAAEHAAAMVPDACVTTISGDEEYPSYRRLNRMGRSLHEPTGPLDHGRAYLGSWEEAARYFGAVEGYSDNSGFGTALILAPASGLGIEDPSGDRMALVPLTPYFLDTGFEIWYPTFLFAGYEAATVYAPSPCSVGPTDRPSPASIVQTARTH